MLSRVLRSVAVVALPGVAPFELGVLCEVFGVDRTDQGVPALDFRVVTPDPGPGPHQLGVLGRRAARARRRRGRRPRRGPGLGGQRRLRHRRARHRRPRARDAPPGRRARRLDPQRLHRGLRPRRGRPAGRPALHHALAAHRPARRASTRRPSSTRACSTCRTATWSPAPAPRPASTRACTWCARSTAPPSPAPSRAGWWCPPHRDGGQAQFVDTPVPACDDPGMAPVVAVGAGAPARGPAGVAAGPRGADVRAHLRPPVPRHHGGQPGVLGQRPAARPGPHACWRRPSCRWRRWPGTRASAPLRC